MRSELSGRPTRGAAQEDEQEWRIREVLVRHMPYRAWEFKLVAIE